MRLYASRENQFLELNAIVKRKPLRPKYPILQHIMPVRENPLKAFDTATKLIIDSSIISNATQMRKVMSNEDHKRRS